MSPPPPVHHSSPPTASVPPAYAPPLRWWKRHGLGFLVISIAAHVSFGVVAAYFIVQNTQVKVTTQVWIPKIRADFGPESFQPEGIVQPEISCVPCKARGTAPESFTLHFVGAGDDVMTVNFNGRLVLDRSIFEH